MLEKALANSFFPSNKRGKGEGGYPDQKGTVTGLVGHARLVISVAEHVIHGREVKVHLARVLRLERPHLQIDNDEASQLQMVEEQVEPEILSSNLQRNLAADESKAYAKFNQELPQVRQEFPFEISRLRLLRESQKSKLYGSLIVCWARSDCGAGRVA